jgi:ABC-type dipeptide/oligopeptide/nickel transport system ATPase component
MRLLEAPHGRIAGGSILLEGEDLVKKSESEMRRVRGNDISMIFQEPMTSLNPVYTVGEQIAESIRIHQNKTPQEAMKRAVEMLELVGISEPARRADTYPHQMSDSAS